jgi:hypothetical protein
MTGCPDRALGFVQHFCGDRSQQKAVKHSMTVGRQNNQVGISVASRLDEFPGRVAS